MNRIYAMKVFSSFCLSLAIFQLGRASVLPGQFEKEPLGDVVRYNSNLKTLAPIISNSSVLTTCTGTINATSGGIAYKAFEPIATNERCLWTIRGGDQNGFMLNVLNLGISNTASSSDTQLIATCVRFRGTATHILLNQTGPVNGLESCSPLVITFGSGNNIDSSAGFVLEYDTLRLSGLSPRSQDYIVDANNAQIIRHPNSASGYDNFELTTFVFFPTLGSNTNVIYFKQSLEGNTCYDTLSVYRFNATSVVPTKWQYEGRMCGNVLSDLISNEDLILITFDTDVSNVGNGFQLAIAACDASQCRM